MKWFLAMIVSALAVVEAAPQAPSSSSQPPGPTPTPAPTSSAPAAPSAPATVVPSVNPNACGQIDAMTRSFAAAFPEVTRLRVPAQMAFDCLQTVPNKIPEAVAMLQSLRAFMQLQSSLAWLKDPPADYGLPPTDVLALMDEIETKAQAGDYASEYEFQEAIFLAITGAHDGHFAWFGDVFKAFVFGNPLLDDLVSVSADGVSLPQLFHKNDLLNNPDTASPIAQLNGGNLVSGNAAVVLEDLILQESRFQDANSMWNSQFPTFAAPDNLNVLSASVTFKFPNITVTYANGTERFEETVAYVRSVADFTSIFTGEDYYQTFCNPATGTDNTPTAEPSFPPEPTIPGYPMPVVRDTDANVTHGYFLEGEGYEDTAVLVVSSFVSGNPFVPGFSSLNYLIDMQKTLDRFFEECRNAGKSKLILDMTSNGGGLVTAGFELISQFFPNPQRFAAANMRLADSLITMARVVNTPDVLNTELPAGFLTGEIDPADLTPQQQAFVGINRSPVLSNFLGGEDPLGNNFTDISELLGPVSIQGDSFTAYQSYNDESTSDVFNLTGVGSRADLGGDTFEPANIAILTDGTCGSTCTVVAYMMLGQSTDIRFVAAGGRPQPGRMQAIAGVEGAQLFPMSDISAAAQLALDVAPAELQAEIGQGDLGLLAEGLAVQRLRTSSAGAVNGKNAFSMADSRTPLQFLRMEANCRVFYTPDMVSDVTAIWKRARDGAFTNPARFCVEGSIVENNDFGGVLDPLFRLEAENSGAARDSNLRLVGLVAVVVAGMMVL